MHDKPALSRRLKKIIGQLNGINKMIDDNAPCPDILIQINAAKSALHKIGQIVLEGHITHCVRDSLQHDEENVKEVLDELAKAIDHFSRMS